MSEREDHLRAIPLTPYIGSEVRGVEFRKPVSAEVIAAVRALLLERQVLFFPDQHLSPQVQSELAARFGEIDVPGQARPGAPRPEIVVFDSRQANGRVPRWHADVTSRLQPQSIQVLQVISTPGVGGDTLFVSGEGAYQTLSEPLKTLVEPLRDSGSSAA
jgi:alpha-ketoglutarate-dependent taurine dioxygenase